MKFRAVLSVLLVLFLLMPAALAAPARDDQLQGMAVDPGMQLLLETVFGAAVLSDVQGMEESLPASPALIEATLALGLEYGLFTEKEENCLLSQELSAEFVSRLFTCDAYTPLTQSQLGFFVPGEGGSIQYNLSALLSNPSIGVYVYSVAFDGEKVQVLGDVYTHYEDHSMSAEVLPEDAMRWFCHGQATLTYHPEMYFGYTLDSFALSPVYLNGQLSDWQTIENTTYEYSVNLPSIFGLADDAPAAMHWQTADGDAELLIQVHTDYTDSYDDTLSAFLLTNPMQQVTEQREFSQFSAVGEGVYTLWIIPEDLPWAYTVSMTFPQERRAEYTLYAEFIRNSMSVWGLANG